MHRRVNFAQMMRRQNNKARTGWRNPKIDIIYDQWSKLYPYLSSNAQIEIQILNGH